MYLRIHPCRSPDTPTLWYAVPKMGQHYRSRLARQPKLKGAQELPLRRRSQT